MAYLDSCDCSKITFVTAILAAAYVCRRCYTSPNPPPDRREEKDTLMGSYFYSRSSHDLNRSLVTLLAGYYVSLILFPPTQSASICPNPANLNPRLFQWSWFTAASLAIMIVAGCVRILAYHQLGENFTFELAQPKRLVTTGIYHYVQHPSYTTKALVAISMTVFFLRDDGPVGCWLPEQVVRYRLFSAVIWGAWCLVGWGAGSTRVHEEEIILRRVFGKEWEHYASRTARFIPWIY